MRQSSTMFAGVLATLKIIGLVSLYMTVVSTAAWAAQISPRTAIYTGQACSNTVANGQSVTAYKTYQVPGQMADCGQNGANFETRKCTNGTLSGSYTNKSCIGTTVTYRRS